jgi:hypothetical protein
MKIAHTSIKTTFVLLVVLTFCLSNLRSQPVSKKENTETEQKEPATPNEARQQPARSNFVKMTDFYLRDGRLVFGRLLSDDKNKITIEQLDEDKMVVSTYSKKEVDTRTEHTKNIPEYQYYLELAEYFAGRTWDFRDDPDDFIQALRSYEQARRLLAEIKDPNSEKISQIDQKIEHLQADRELWIKEATSRARLKKLEFEADIEKRVKELEDKLNSINQQVNKTIADIKNDYQKLEKGLSDMNKDISSRLEIIDERVGTNRRLIERIIAHHHWRWYPPYIILPERFDSNQ